MDDLTTLFTGLGILILLLIITTSLAPKRPPEVFEEPPRDTETYTQMRERRKAEDFRENSIENLRFALLLEKDPQKRREIYEELDRFIKIS